MLYSAADPEMLEQPAAPHDQRLDGWVPASEGGAYIAALAELPPRLGRHDASAKRGEGSHRSASGIFSMKSRRRSSPRPSPSSCARLRSLTCTSTSATSSHGTRTRPPPPSQAATR